MFHDEQLQKEHESQLDKLDKAAKSHTKELKKGQNEFHFLKGEISIIKADVADIKSGLQQKGLINGIQDKRLDTLEQDLREGDKSAKDDLRSFREEMSVTRSTVVNLAAKMTDLSAAVATCTTLMQKDTEEETEAKTEKRAIADRRLLILTIIITIVVGISAFLVGAFGMNGAHAPTWLQPVLHFLGGA